MQRTSIHAGLCLALLLASRGAAEETGTGPSTDRQLIEADYIAPARFYDLLTVVTAPKATGRARLSLVQQVFRAETLLFDSSVTLVALGPDGRPVRLPAELRAKLGG